MRYVYIHTYINTYIHRPTHICILVVVMMSLGRSMVRLWPRSTERRARQSWSDRLIAAMESCILDAVGLVVLSTSFFKDNEVYRRREEGDFRNLPHRHLETPYVQLTELGHDRGNVIEVPRGDQLYKVHKSKLKVLPPIPRKKRPRVAEQPSQNGGECEVRPRPSGWRVMVL